MLHDMYIYLGEGRVKLLFPSYHDLCFCQGEGGVCSELSTCYKKIPLAICVVIQFSFLLTFCFVTVESFMN